MPTYQYRCDVCDHGSWFFDVVKSMSESGRIEHCPQCGKQAERIYSAPQISPAAKAYEPHWNYGLGKVILNKGQVKEELARIKGETGKEIVEVGTDNLSSVKPIKKSYDYTREDVERVKASISQ